MLMSVEDLQSGFLVKMSGGDAVLCDGRDGGWCIVGGGSDKMYHTMFYANDLIFTNKAGLERFDFEWIFDARSFSILDMIRLVKDDKYRKSFNKVYHLWDRRSTFEKLKELYNE